MKILHLSDTHGKHRELTDMPPADVLVHSGDFTLAGGDMEALDFIEWLCDLPYKHKIFIAGNHDDCMMDATLPDVVDVLITHRPPLGILDSIDDNLHYGSSFLLDKVSQIKPKMQLFGHVHDAYGTKNWKGMTFSNASVTDWQYNIRYAPQKLEI